MRWCNACRIKGKGPHAPLRVRHMHGPSLFTAVQPPWHSIHYASLWECVRTSSGRVSQGKPVRATAHSHTEPAAAHPLSRVVDLGRPQLFMLQRNHLDCGWLTAAHAWVCARFPLGLYMLRAAPVAAATCCLL